MLDKLRSDEEFVLADFEANEGNAPSNPEVDSIVQQQPCGSNEVRYKICLAQKVISPKHGKEFVWPPENQWTDFARSALLRIRVTFDGNVMRSIKLDMNDGRSSPCFGTVGRSKSSVYVERPDEIGKICVIHDKESNSLSQLTLLKKNASKFKHTMGQLPSKQGKTILTLEKGARIMGIKGVIGADNRITQIAFLQSVRI